MVLTCLSAAAQQPAQEPYKDARKNPAAFAGPGREEPEPGGLKEVVLGWFGPSEGPMWEAAQQAISEANRAGGYKGLPFRLAAGWAADPWRAGAAHLTRIVFRERAWAVIAAANGDAAHLAEQVVAKALLTLVNPVATDRTIHGAGVPWMFSCVQGDHMLAPLIAEAVTGTSRVVVFSATDHDSRALLAKLSPLVRVSAHIEFEVVRPDLAEPAARVLAARPDAVIVLANAADSARAVKALRSAGYEGLVAGGPWVGRAEFRRLAGDAGQGVRYPVLSSQTRFPDYAAACAYDAVNMLVAAVRKAGLNRTRIRDAMEKLAPYEGASGRIEWDETGQNRRPPAPGTVRP